MKKTIVAVTCMLTLLLSGCGSNFPDLSEEEVAVIGEYAAVTLLKYDANSRSRLVDLSREEEKPVLESEPEPEQKPEPIVPEQPENQLPHEQEQGQINDNGEVADSIESFLELPEGVSLSYAGYDVCQSYQGNEGLYFALEASQGKELLIVRFELQNESATAQEINLLGRRDNYRLTVNDTYTRTALTTLLMNDMSTYIGTLEAGSSEEVVLLIEVDTAEAENLQSISLNLKNESKTYTIPLL